MADTKISALASAAPANALQEFPVNDLGTSRKLTVDQLRELILRRSKA